MKFDVFISYSSVDTQSVKVFNDRLERAGLETCFDRTFLPGTEGESWRTSLREALSDSRAVILWGTEAALNSGEVAEEIELALEIQKKGGGPRPRILPLDYGLRDNAKLFEESRLSKIGEIQFFDMRTSYANSFDRVISILSVKEPSKKLKRFAMVLFQELFLRTRLLFVPLALLLIFLQPSLVAGVEGLKVGDHEVVGDFAQAGLSLVNGAMFLLIIPILMLLVLYLGDRNHFGSPPLDPQAFLQSAGVIGLIAGCFGGLVYAGEALGTCRHYYLQCEDDPTIGALCPAADLIGSCDATGRIASIDTAALIRNAVWRFLRCVLFTTCIGYAVAFATLLSVRAAHRLDAPTALGSFRKCFLYPTSVFFAAICLVAVVAGDVSGFGELARRATLGYVDWIGTGMCTRTQFERLGQACDLGHLPNAAIVLMLSVALAIFFFLARDTMAHQRRWSTRGALLYVVLFGTFFMSVGSTMFPISESIFEITTDFPYPKLVHYPVLMMPTICVFLIYCFLLFDAHLEAGRRPI